MEGDLETVHADDLDRPAEPDLPVDRGPEDRGPLKTAGFAIADLTTCCLTTCCLASAGFATCVRLAPLATAGATPRAPATTAKVIARRFIVCSFRVPSVMGMSVGAGRPRRRSCARRCECHGRYTDFGDMEWPLLADLPSEDVRQLLSIARRRTFERGEVVFHRDDPADSLHLVVRGRFGVRVTTPVGDSVLLDVLGPGGSFGEIALLLPDSRRSATVSALEDGETRSIFRDDFARLQREHPGVKDVLLRLLAERAAPRERQDRRSPLRRCRDARPAPARRARVALRRRRRSARFH